MQIYQFHNPVGHLYPDKSCKWCKQRGEKQEPILIIYHFIYILYYAAVFTEVC